MENKVAALRSALALFPSPLREPRPPSSRPFIFKSPPLAKRAGGRRVFLSRRKITHCPVSGALSFPLAVRPRPAGRRSLARSLAASSLPTEIKAEEVRPTKEDGREKIKEKGKKTGEPMDHWTNGDAWSQAERERERGRPRRTERRERGLGGGCSVLFFGGPL